MIVPATPESIARAAALLRAGELVAFPTETVYGLGADAANAQAAAKIFAVKGRPADHPLIVHLGAIEALDDWAREVPDAARKLAQTFWPGPLTLIVPRAPHVLDAVTGAQASVGLRMPAHPVARALLREFGGAIAAPSANRFGRVSATTAQHVDAEFGAQIALVLDGGPCAVGIESTIVDFTSGRAVLLRPGGVPVQALAEVLGYAPHAPTRAAPRASGRLASHYAPRAPTELLAPAMLAAAVVEVEERGHLCGVLARSVARPAHTASLWKQMPPDPATYARELYATLRELDVAGAARIFIEALPATPEWLAVNDRLQRAARRGDAEELD